MITTVFFAIITFLLYVLLPVLDLRVLRKALGIALFLDAFYLTGYYMAAWPFPTPMVLVQILIVVALGVALGVVFSRIWPLPPHAGFERIVRTFLIVIPALGLGVGLQVLIQGNQATQAIYLIFAIAAWLGSGHFIRRENSEEKKSKFSFSSLIERK
jgi:hypothetical protein